MASANIIAAWKHGRLAWAAGRVDEAGRGVEYVASTPLLDDQGQAKTVARLKADLTAALKAERDRQLTTPTDVAISGTVTL